MERSILAIALLALVVGASASECRAKRTLCCQWGRDDRMHIQGQKWASKGAQQRSCTRS